MDAKTKWNQKYEEQVKDFQTQEPNKRLVHCSTYFTGKRALDLAMGLGKNSLFLAEQGFSVTALDISDVAVKFVQEQGKSKGLDINCHVIDLTHLQELTSFGKFDLVVSTYYLDRNIFPMIISLLSDGGLFFMETFSECANKDREIPRKYELKSQELLKSFQNYHVLFFEENEIEGRQTILIRK